MPSERQGVGTGQTALHPPQDPETPATVWVVAANYADDPHPHIEAVYDNEEAARQHEQEIQDDIRPSAPIAWWVYEETVKEESYAE